MKSKVRFGILGAARINRKVVPAIQRAENAEVCAIASRTLEKAEEAANQYHIPTAYGSYEELLADPGIDAVYIPLPNALHVEWVKKTAEKGKHILCEKPLGITADEVSEAIDICNLHGVQLMDGFMWPHHPRTKSIRSLLDSQRLGEVRHVETVFTFALDRTKFDIRRTKEMGGGALYDIGCYCISAIQFTMGMPHSVSAVAHWENGIDLQMSVLFEFSGGRTASAYFGFLSPYTDVWEIHGTQSRLSVPRPWAPNEKALLEVWAGTEKVESQSFDNRNQIDEMVTTFSSNVIENKRAVNSYENALNIARITDAIYLSAREKQKTVLQS